MVRVFEPDGREGEEHQLTSNTVSSQINNSKPTRAVVVHAGNRDRYQVALGLEEAGLLEKLVTDVYFPLDKTWFLRIFGKLLPKRFMSKRYCPGLPSDKVCSSAKAMGIIIANRFLLSKKNLHPVSDAVLGRRARLLAHNTGAAIFSYSTYASQALRPYMSGADSVKTRLLFQMHPHPASAYNLLFDELKIVPDARNSLLQEYEMSIPRGTFRQLVSEPLMANSIFVASSFCAQTVIKNGVSPSQIHVIPYGVDAEGYPEKSRDIQPRGALKVVFLGSIIQRKGISYLLEAMKLLKGKAIQLVLCGRIAPDKSLLQKYQDCAIEFKVGLSHREVLHELHSADVFVFPSLLEGFAHVILEAMSCGLPVITTQNTCGPDVVVEGEHGFIIPIRDVDALVNRLEWCLSHREVLAEMGRQAANRAREFTWDRFRQGVRTNYIQSVSPDRARSIPA